VNRRGRAASGPDPCDSRTTRVADRAHRGSGRLWSGWRVTSMLRILPSSDRTPIGESGIIDSVRDKAAMIPRRSPGPPAPLRTSPQVYRHSFRAGRPQQPERGRQQGW
jgi:hypothetical protein